MLVFGGFSVEHSVVAKATSPELEVTAPSQVRLGEAIGVTLTLSGADQVAGYEALARFDEHAAEFGGLFPGGEDAPAATGNTAIADGAKDGTAFAVYTCVTSGCPTGAASVLEGSKQLRNVTLRIVPDRAGILEIDLDQVRFVDSLGNRLDVGVSGNHLAVVVASGAMPIAAPTGDFVLSDNPVTTPNAPTAGPNRALDVTGDGSVTSADVSMVSLAWMHAREVGGVCSAEPGADVNGDGCVDVSDLQAVASTTDPTVATAPRGGATTAARPSIEAAAVPGTGQQFVVDTESD